MSLLPAVLLLSLASVAGAAPPQKSSIHPDVLAGMFVAFDSRANGDAYAELPKLDDGQRQAATTALTSFLKDKHPEARAKACAALSAIGLKPQIVPVLINVLEGDDDWHVRAAAAAALGRAVPPTKESTTALTCAAAGDEELGVRAEAIKALKALGWSAKAPLEEGLAIKARIPGLIRKLGSKDDAERGKAAETLWRIGDLSAPALIAAIEHEGGPLPWAQMRFLKRGENPDYRKAMEAAMVLYAIGQDPSGKAPPIRSSHPNAQKWRDAEMVLSFQGIATLLIALESRFPATRRFAAEKIKQYASKPEINAAALPLVKALSDDAKAVRASAYNTLLGLRVNWPVVVPALQAALKDGKAEPQQVVELLCRIAFWSKDPQPLIPVLTSFPDERLRALLTLGGMGPDAKAAVPFLIPLLGAEHSVEIRGEAINALARMGPAAAEAEPALLKLADDKTVWNSPYAGLHGLITGHHAGITPKISPPVLGDLAKKALRKIRAKP